MIVTYALQTRGSEMWLVGRVFDCGLKPAHNGRIKPNLISKYGIQPRAMMV